jgi:hypothetical protein
MQATAQRLTLFETDVDQQDRTCLIVRCKDKAGVFIPCLAIPLDENLLARNYDLPLEFQVECAGHSDQSNV